MNKFSANRVDDTGEIGYKISKENDRIDAKYGFERVKDTQERTGYLFNIHSVSVDLKISNLTNIYLPTLNLDGNLESRSSSCGCSGHVFPANGWLAL